MGFLVEYNEFSIKGMRKHIMDPTGINEEHFDVVCQETRDSLIDCMSMSKL